MAMFFVIPFTTFEKILGVKNNIVEHRPRFSISNRRSKVSVQGLSTFI